MPKTEIDYSNTIIYKITCKDPGIKDVYVGHTTNFVQRKHAHKQSCINVKSPNHKCKLYTIIREHGGWQNWTMEIINFFNCNDHYEAIIKEHEYFMLLNATLNSIDPMPKPKSHVKPVHNVIEMSNVTQSLSRFCCKVCDYHTSKPNEYTKHLATVKHEKRTNYKNKSSNIGTPFTCCCGKQYAYDSGYYKHKKKCQSVVTTPDISNNVVIDKEFVMLLIKENSEFKTTMIDLQNKMLDVLKIVTNNSIQPN